MRAVLRKAWCIDYPPGELMLCSYEQGLTLSIELMVAAAGKRSTTAAVRPAEPRVTPSGGLLDQLVEAVQEDQRATHDEERARLAIHEASGDHRTTPDDHESSGVSDPRVPRAGARG